MAAQTRGRREKQDKEMGLCNCVAAVFQVLVAFQSIAYISGQGHLNPDAESQPRSVLEDVSLFPTQQPYGVTSEMQNLKQNLVSQINSQIGVIRFEPPFLDFDTECVGMPKLRTVYIHNPHKEYDLQLSSISARTSHFHASFFDKKIVPPGGNTSFEVVFLPRVEGNVENTLFINTVYGTHAYQVFGIGIPNPYRLRPYLGAKVPLNSSFSPLISMHNPTSETLQVTEMYSSSGYLQLHLPQGQTEVDKEQWAIPPYGTKEVIRARFLGHVEANHTAFIRIKTEQEEVEGPHFHILPVEVEVSSAPGIYSALELLDFGILRTRYDEPKSLPLFLLNSGDHEVQISSVSLAVPNPAIEISYSKTKLKPSPQTIPKNMFTLVANVTFSAYLARSEADQKGIIIVKSKDKSYRNLEIPFFANVLEGTLGYDQQGVLFHFDIAKTVKEVKLSNLFKFPVVLQSLTLPPGASKIFKVLDFNGPVTLPVSLQTSPFSIEYNPGKHLSRLLEDVTDDRPGSAYHLTLHTNASKFSLPLYTFSGKILYKVLREDKEKIDFGIMGTNDKRQVLFALYNHNPTKILLEKINSTLKNIQIHLVSLTEEDSGKNLTYDENSKLEHFWLPTNSCSVFEVKLTATDREEDIVDSIKIVTKYQEIVIPVLAKIVIGTLTVKPEKIKFSKSFPGRVVHQTLAVVNTFAQPTKLEYVHAEQVDKRFYYKKLKNQGLKLEPNKQAKIGKVYFDARLGCKPDRCYTGLPTSTTVGHHWLTTLALGMDSVEFDTKRYKEHRRRWKNVRNKGLTGPNTTLVLSADVVMNVKVPVQAALYWPSLLKEDSFDFPLTHVGRKSVATLKLHNPADSPVIVQVLPLSLYPQPEAVLRTLGWEENLYDESFIINNSTVFHLLDPRQESIKDSMSAQMVWLEYTLNGKLNHSVVNLFLEAGDKVELKVEFIPYDDNPKSTVLLLRNNLTILDAIPLYGRGAYEHLTLGGRAPNGKSSVLRFKLTKELLKDCTRAKINPSFTVRKWFHANNTGVLPIHITSMTVSGSPCEGYGFRVLDCDQFILQPGTSKKIEIAYTPDFTSHLVLHKLRLITSQGNEMIFTLNVTLPPHMITLCQESVPRPSWELTLYHFIACVVLIISIGVLLMGFLESVTIWDSYVRVHYADIQERLAAIPATPHNADGFEKPFDLREIGKNYALVSSTGDETGLDSICSDETSSMSICNSSFESSHLPDKSNKYSDKPVNKPQRFLSRLFSFFRRADKKQPRESSFSDSFSVEEINSVSKLVPTLNEVNGPQIRHRTVCNEKRKNDKKFRSLDHVIANCHDPYTKPTAEIHPVAKISEISKRKSSASDSLEKLTVEKLEKITPKKKDDSRERRSDSEESTTHNVVESKTNERRRTHSKSSQRSRESTSSSESFYTPEPIVVQQKCACQTSDKKYKSRGVEEIKPVRARKLKKLTRKQMKALAKEETLTQSRGNETKAQLDKPASTACEKVANDASKLLSSSEKKCRQQKRRSDSSESAASAKPSKKSSVSECEVPRAVHTRNKENKATTKRRSYSYSTDIARPKDKPGKITICKRPSPPSSSSHEVSESSSSDSSALWDTPGNIRDADEDMRQIARQSQQAELMIGNKQRKERKRGKGAASPAHLTSGSRSSSYSSIMSSGSNDSNPSRPTNIGISGKSSPSKKLSRSKSDTTGGTPTVSLLRKHSPCLTVDSSNNSPTRTLRLDTGDLSPSLQQNQINRPSRTLSSPSMPVNSFLGRPSGLGIPSFDERDARRPHPSQIVASSYSAFGDSAFNLVGDVIGPKRDSSGLSTTWESPFCGNSSLYSTPSPSQMRNRSPSDLATSFPQQWNSVRSPVQQHSGYVQYDAPPGTPTTPGILSQPPTWGDIPTATTSTNMTTHSIWSVSNAVTMDENRDTEEGDPLGVRSIWSNTAWLQRWNNSH